jgi:aminoglycoside 3-N-acetyltransferase I
MVPAVQELHVRRLAADDRDMARALFSTMAAVFETRVEPLSDAYIDRLLGVPTFWAFAAFDGGGIIGGLTAHTLPMTSGERSEILIYDIAVREDRQRQGVGRRLVAALLESAAGEGIGVVFVPADNEDTHALDFYRALGGQDSPVTFFTFDVQSRTREEKK